MYYGRLGNFYRLWKYDATKLAHPVNVPELIKDYPSTKIHADGEYVGLPHGQMGNSEVGHLNLGAGRVVYQDLSKINRAIKDGSFFKNEKFLEAIEHAKKNNSSLHIYGLVSTGGVHSSLDHVLALIKLAADEGLKKFMFMHSLTVVTHLLQVHALTCKPLKMN